MIGTLTSNILKSAHTSISPISFYKLCSVATPGYYKPLLLENHVRIIALTPDLQRVSFDSVIDFLHHSSNTELILFPILYKGVLFEFYGLTTISESSSALWLLWRADLCKIATRLVPRIKASDDFG